MSTDMTACPHCHGPRDARLIPGNYLCADCSDRATDALGWQVSIVTEAGDDGLPTVLLAVHEDWTQCDDVGSRRRAYVDDIAFLALTGELGEAYLQPLPLAEPPGTETTPGPGDTEKFWELVHVALTEDVRWLKDDDFLLVEYNTGDPGYAVYGQLTPRDDGYHLEVVSNQYLPADDWPLDVGYLQQAAWTTPDAEAPNWHRFVRGPAQATASLLAGLRYGRDCVNPLQLGWESATFPLAGED
ncbi:TY-Chap domain-containing protein [Arthrobacter sp. TMN-49]